LFLEKKHSPPLPLFQVKWSFPNAVNTVKKGKASGVANILADVFFVIEHVFYLCINYLSRVASASDWFLMYGTILLLILFLKVICPIIETYFVIGDSFSTCGL
jgi:hypothetical protein